MDPRLIGIITPEELKELRQSVDKLRSDYANSTVGKFWCTICKTHNYRLVYRRSWDGMEGGYYCENCLENISKNRNGTTDKKIEPVIISKKIENVIIREKNENVIIRENIEPVIINENVITNNNVQ